MTVSAPSITESDIETALRGFLVLILPAQVDVIRGQVNRVPEPQHSNYVVFWPMRRPRLGTNVDEVTDAGDGMTITQPTEVVYQLQVHGPQSADNSQRISTLFRDAFAVDSMPAAVSPLYADDPQQLAFSNDQQQYEDRWIVEAHMEVDPTITVTIESADSLGPVILHEADARNQ
jgi:hypothetical protein